MSLNPTLVGQTGLLPTRGSPMLDIVFLALFVVVGVLAFSIFQVRFRRRYALHKTTQLAVSLVLLVAIVAFEIDLRLFTDWRSLAEPSPYYPLGWVDRALWVHLVFAIPTPLVWIYVIVGALRGFPRQPGPNAYSRIHRRNGWIAAVLMVMTALTGWTFYWMAFVA